MASGAIRGEKFVAILEVARFFDLGLELRDELVFLLLFGTSQSVNDFVSVFGHDLVAVCAEPVKVCRTEQRRFDAFLGQRLHQQE
jgi:hypothetical protein